MLIPQEDQGGIADMTAAWRAQRHEQKNQFHTSQPQPQHGQKADKELRKLIDES